MKKLFCLMLFGAVVLATTSVLPAYAQVCYGCTASEHTCFTHYEDMGWKVCYCSGGCSCSASCGVVASLDEVQQGQLVPPNGFRLNEMPSKAFLSSLDRAKQQGVVTHNVYFANTFAIVVSQESAKVYPLETPEKFALRDCSGGFLGRFRRVRTST